MKTKRTLTIAAVLVALATLTTLRVIRGTRQVHAQDQLPPQVNDRISFGMVGITQGQTIRLSVVNTVPPGIGDLPPGPYRVVLTFLDTDGHRLRTRDGSIIRRVMELQPGQATFLDLSYDELPPGPYRLQLRAVITVEPPPMNDSNGLPPSPIVSSVEVINNANGRTAFVVAAAPSVQRLQPPPVPE